MCFLNPSAENTNKIRIKNNLGDTTTAGSQQNDTQNAINQAVADALAQQQQEQENNQRPEQDQGQGQGQGQQGQGQGQQGQQDQQQQGQDQQGQQDQEQAEALPVEETPTDPDAGQDTADAQQDAADVADTTAEEQSDPDGNMELVLVGYDQDGNPIYEPKKDQSGGGEAGGAGGQGTAGGTA